MNILGEEGVGGGGGNKSKDAELAKAMFEGALQYRKKLKLPEMNSAAESIKETVRWRMRGYAYALARGGG